MTKNNRRAVFAALAFMATSMLSTIPANAAGSHEGGHGHGHGAAVGAPGEAARVSRTVNVTMRDNYFEPESITVAPGETVRFVVANAGEFVHEFNIGTADMHREHQKEMMMMVEHEVLMPDRIDRQAAARMQQTMGHGMHDDANSVLLEPGKTAELVWTFPAGSETTIEFGCNVPGHYEAGMVGEFRLGKNAR